MEDRMEEELVRSGKIPRTRYEKVDGKQEYQRERGGSVGVKG